MTCHQSLRIMGSHGTFYNQVNPCTGLEGVVINLQRFSNRAVELASFLA